MISNMISIQSMNPPSFFDQTSEGGKWGPYLPLTVSSPEKSLPRIDPQSII